MPKPFDATIKGMLEGAPADWPRLIGETVRSVKIVDADVSTHSGGADKVLRVKHVTGEESIQHFEFQAGADGEIPQRLVLYNALLENRHSVPVWSTVVLLRREADHGNITGVYRRDYPGRGTCLEFHYGVVLNCCTANGTN